MRTTDNIKKDIDELIVLVRECSSIDNNKKDVIDDYLRGIQYSGIPDFSVAEVKEKKVPSVITRIVKDLMSTEDFSVQEEFKKIIDKL